MISLGSLPPDLRFAGREPTAKNTTKYPTRAELAAREQVLKSAGLPVPPITEDYGREPVKQIGTPKEPFWLEAEETLVDGVPFFSRSHLGRRPGRRVR